MSCTQRRVSWLLANLGRIDTERPAPTDNSKQSSSSNMSRSGSKSFKSRNSPRMIRSCMRGGTTGRDDEGNGLGVDKPSGFIPEIIGGGVLEPGTATGSETVATAGVSGGGGAARLDTGWCVSSAEHTAAETASAIQYLIWGSDGAAFTLSSAAAREGAESGRRCFSGGATRRCCSGSVYVEEIALDMKR